MCLTFDGRLPERIYVQYMSYRVRPFERAPLRCFCCQQYGHAAAVCTANKICGRCGKENCQEECEGKVQAECLHCGGDHHAGSAKCPRTIKEVKVNRVRTEKKMSYAEALKRVEGHKEKRVDEKRETEEKGNGNICMEKTRFLAFISMVINCAVEIQRKSERIKMVLAAAKRFLNVLDVTGEDLDSLLREEYTEPPPCI